jgi:phage terminase large subunit
VALSQERKMINKVKEWAFSPLTFVREVWGEEPTFQQEAALKDWGLLIRAKVKSAKGAELTDEEKPYKDKLGMSIQSGQDSGKSHFAAWIGLHGLFCFPHSKTRVTAPAGPQIESVLWPEFHKLWRQAEMLKQNIEHRATKIYMKEGGGSEWFIEPRTIQKNSSPEEQAEVLGGLHERYMTIIVDEASGVPDAVFRPLEGGLGGVCNLILMIFNPTQSHGYAIDSQSKFRKYWVCHHWDCEELAKTNPVFAPHMQADHARLAEKYGKDSNFYRIRVKGLPPLAAPDVLIPWDWVMDAMHREAEVDPLEPLTIGVDVGGQGDDKTVIIPGRGHVIIPHSPTMPFYEVQGMDTTQIAWKVEGCIRELLTDEQGQYAVAIDSIGLGAGVFSHLSRIANLRNLYDVNVAEVPSQEERYHRLRDELWWNLREAFEKRLISLPMDDELLGELTNIHWREENGKIRIESKKELRKRGVASPNKADALCLREFARRYCISRVPRRARRQQNQTKAVPWVCS